MIALISLLWMLTARSQETDQLTATVNRDGNVINEIDLNKIDETQYITIEEGLKVVLQVEPGRIRFIEADCPDKICIK